ncbi:MAG TPA: hypothetical protein VIT23_08765, partial [Terrimicrobiaceae bacterium]
VDIGRFGILPESAWSFAGMLRQGSLWRSVQLDRWVEARLVCPKKVHAILAWEGLHRSIRAGLPSSPSLRAALLQRHETGLFGRC